LADCRAYLLCSSCSSFGSAIAYHNGIDTCGNGQKGG
jgi:hypothetical protein